MANNIESQELMLQLNDFYRDNYRRTMKWLSVMVIVCAILSAILAWISYDRKQPPYYAAVITGQVVPMHSLSEPVITTRFIERWCERTTQILYNLSFNSYQQEIVQAKDRFTADGWTKMMSAMQSSIIDPMVKNHLVITSVVSGTPLTLAQLIVNGRYTWRMQLNLLVTFTSASEVRKRTLSIIMDVQRVPALDAAQGIQIINFTSANAD